MWDIPFDESMLTAKPGVAIFCPEEALAEELFGILKRNDISWPHSSPRWSNYGESTVYCVSGSRVKFGTKDAVNRINPYCNYIKCTFYGIDTPDFDVASDDELRALFGIGGG